MPLIPFPDVPNLPGVPTLARSALQSLTTQSTGTLLTGDDLGGLSGGFSDPQWGIFDSDGNSALDVDSVVSVDAKKEFRISDYPVERGSFSSFNKVETPRDVPVVVTKGGSDDVRQKFLADLDTLIASIDLYSIYTAEWQYENMNPVSHEVRRSSRNGVSLIAAEIIFREVRISASSSFTNTQSPAGAAQANGGTVQPQTPSAGQSAAAASGAD